MRDVTPVTHTHTDRRTVESSAVFCLSRIRNILQSQLCSKVDCNTFSWTPSDDSVLEQLGVDIHVWWPLPPSSTRAAFLPSFAEKLQKRSTSPWSGRRARTSFAFLCGGRVEGAVNANLIIMASSSSTSTSSSSLSPPLSSIS